MELNKWYGGNPIEDSLRIAQIECPECKQAGFLYAVKDDFHIDGTGQEVWCECSCGGAVNLTFKIERKYKLIEIRS